MPFSACDLETRALLNTAYDVALRATGTRYSSTPRSNVIASLTKGLLDAAGRGERDPDKLRLAALIALRAG